MTAPAPPPPSWAADLAAARAGHIDALGRVLEVGRRYLLAVAGGEIDTDLQAKAGASDLVQDSLLEARRDFGRFHGTGVDELYAWLREILRNNLANFRRHYRETAKRDVAREVPLPEPPWGGLPGDQLPADSTSPSGAARQAEARARLEAALGRLPPEYRDVIVWRQRDGVSFDDIGQRLGRTAAGARQVWWRALDRLRRDLGAVT